MSERIDISTQIAGFCAALGLPDKSLVRRLEFTPTVVTAEIYEVNADGAKFIRENGEVAIETRVIEVST